MLFVWYKVSFDEKWSHGSAVCETVYFFVEFVCVFPWKCVSLNNQNRGKIMDGILRKLPIGIQTFEKLREGDYLYVDKTALVWRIASTETPYFLSRPRRFGKSLLLSTFEAYFEGKKELFAITMHYTRMMNVDGYALPEKIRNAFLGLEEKEKTLISYFTQHNEQYAKKVGKTATQKTYSRYELTKQRMIEFLQKEYKLSDIPVKEITVTHIENFYLYLRQECEVSNNTAMKFVQRFHTILLFAQKSGLSFIDPFGNFRFNFDKTDRGYLTQEEIDTIYYKEFKSKRLEHVRDAFIFSCYTGLPYCDIYTLSSEDIKIGVDGKKWIMKDRGKTGVESFIPLLQIPLDILAKYEGKLKDGRLLPVISNQKMNEYLAEIAAICQINKRITYHLARHSFATEICLTKGVPIESVSKMLGHTNIQTTQIYARVVDRKLSHDMNMLDRKLKNMQKGTAQNAV